MNWKPAVFRLFVFFAICLPIIVAGVVCPVNFTKHEIWVGSNTKDLQQLAYQTPSFDQKITYFERIKSFYIGQGVGSTHAGATWLANREGARMGNVMDNIDGIIAGLEEGKVLLAKQMNGLNAADALRITQINGSVDAIDLQVGGLTRALFPTGFWMSLWGIIFGIVSLACWVVYLVPREKNYQRIPSFCVSDVRTLLKKLAHQQTKEAMGIK
jgi:hypothetical protein